MGGYGNIVSAVAMGGSCFPLSDILLKFLGSRALVLFACAQSFFFLLFFFPPFLLLEGFNLRQHRRPIS